MFDISNFKNLVENTKSGYIYKTTYNHVATAKLGLDKLFPNSQVNAGILVAILFAIGMYILMNKTTLGYELKACGMNRHSARYAGIRDKRNIVLSMAIAGGLAGGGAALYYLPATRSFSGARIRRSRPRASTASRSPCSRSTTPLPSSSRPSSCPCWTSLACS